MQISLSVGYSRLLQPYIPYLCGNTCPSKTNYSSSWLIKTKLLIYSYCVLIQLLLLFEFRDYNRICLFGLNSFLLCIVINNAVRVGGGLLLFCCSGKTHHKSILPLETFLERLGGRGFAREQQRNFQAEKLPEKPCPVNEEFYNSHKFRPKMSFKLEKSVDTGNKVPDLPIGAIRTTI